MQTLHIHTRTQTNCLHFFLITQTARIAFMIVAVPSCPWREPTGTHWQPWRFWNGRQGCLPLHGPYDQNQPPEPRRSPETFSHSIRHIFSIHTLEKKHGAKFFIFTCCMWLQPQVVTVIPQVCTSHTQCTKRTLYWLSKAFIFSCVHHSQTMILQQPSRHVTQHSVINYSVLI